jgi:hypothetical protein
MSRRRKATNARRPISSDGSINQIRFGSIPPAILTCQRSAGREILPASAAFSLTIRSNLRLHEVGGEIADTMNEVVSQRAPQARPVSG